MRLKQKALNGLSKNVNYWKNTRLGIKKLNLFYKRLLLANVFDKWIEMIDEKNDSELRSKLTVATSFYRSNIVRKYLSKWVGYKCHEKRKKTLTSKAIDFCKTFYCQKYFDVWKIAYTFRRRVAMLEEKVLDSNKLFDSEFFSSSFFPGDTIFEQIGDAERDNAMDNILQ